jgi:hypothetical protein
LAYFLFKYIKKQRAKKKAEAAPLATAELGSFTPDVPGAQHHK